MPRGDHLREKWANSREEMLDKLAAARAKRAQLRSEAETVEDRIERLVEGLARLDANRQFIVRCGYCGGTKTIPCLCYDSYVIQSRLREEGYNGPFGDELRSREDTQSGERKTGKRYAKKPGRAAAKRLKRARAGVA